MRDRMRQFAQEKRLLIEPENVIQKDLKVTINDKTQVFQAYRVQFSSVFGPYKGGIRFHPEADLNEVKVLAALMAIKCALVKIPRRRGQRRLATAATNAAWHTARRSATAHR